jgi:ribosomal protein S12 methylthiotransferase accessory factor
MPRAERLVRPVSDPASPMPGFTVAGGGALATAIADALAAYAAVRVVTAPKTADVDASCQALAVVTDTWDTSGHPSVRQVCADAGLPWLPVRAELGTVVIGPAERAGTPGCGQCVELRSHRTDPNSAGLDAVWHRHAAALAGTPSAWLTRLARDTVGALVAEEMARLARDFTCARTRAAVLRVDLRTLAVARHSFLPEPLCPHCGRLPDDSAELAEITLARRPKPAPDTHRVQSLIEELDTLLDTYVDAETGLIRGLSRSAQGGLAVAAAALPLRQHDRVEFGYGRTRSYRASTLTALLEALERWGGMQPGGKRTVVRASYAQVADRALDPRTLGLHAPESYRTPGFGFRPFDEHQVCDWTWAYSFGRREPILVPQSHAYYSGPGRTTPPGRPFVYEVSNGCALGSCLEEAILYGLLEVAERDAFLMTWYARLPVARLDLSGARDRALPLQAAAITAETGYLIQLHDTTMEHGIPCVWAMAVRPGGGDPDRPAMVCAAGSHLDPERAVLSALSELGPILTDLIRRFPEQADAARKMVADPYLVIGMPDHSLLYGAREAFGRLDFLTGDTPVRSPADMLGDTPDAFRGADLRDDLQEVVRRYLDTGMDVIVVDQTTAEHRVGGFACVKVIVPGTVPMTFGHQHRRVDGLTRPLEVPHRLGHHPRPLRPDELNPHPHPFP